MVSERAFSNCYSTVWKRSDSSKPLSAKLNSTTKSGFDSQYVAAQMKFGLTVRKCECRVLLNSVCIIY